ncbi:MAG: nascent polypeptide-associated complex subunit family protein [Cyclobacteriaceae bacterium]|nr:nascent polypeptide-associated complex subunit family protein [Cyclobacteriaceae bacterium]
MARIKILVTIFICSVLLLSFSFRNSPDCTDWEIKENITKQSNGLFTFELQVSNVVSEIHYIFFKEDGNLISKQFETPKVQDLQPGKYEYMVFGGKGCKVKGKIELK